MVTACAPVLVARDFVMIFGVSRVCRVSRHRNMYDVLEHLGHAGEREEHEGAEEEAGCDATHRTNAGVSLRSCQTNHGHVVSDVVLREPWTLWHTSCDRWAQPSDELRLGERKDSETAESGLGLMTDKHGSR